MQSEYGWTHEYILWHVTPAQALVWADRIQRRRALRLAEETELAYLAATAAQAGKKGHKAIRALVRDLRKVGGVKPPPVDAEELAQSLGLRVKR